MRNILFGCAIHATGTGGKVMETLINDGYFVGVLDVTTTELSDELVGGDKGWLIIDDLVDTGQTGRIVRESRPKAHFATVYAKPAGREIVDTFITEVSQDTWILFPWDTAPQYAQPISAQSSAKAG